VCASLHVYRGNHLIFLAGCEVDLVRRVGLAVIVGSRTTRDEVVSFDPVCSDNVVVSITAVERVCSCAAKDDIVVGAAVDFVRTGTAVELVETGAAEEGVCSPASGQVVVARSPV